MLTIARAETEAQHQTVRALMAEYIAWDATELRRLGLDTRAASLPEGCLLLDGDLTVVIAVSMCARCL